MGDTGAEAVTQDRALITLGFEDRTFGTIHYLTNGGASFAKERVEVFAAGRTLQLDNFLKLRSCNSRRFKKQNLWMQDKRAPRIILVYCKCTTQNQFLIRNLRCFILFSEVLKGQTLCAAAFVKAVEGGGTAPIPAAELFEVAKVTIDVAKILRAQA